MKEIASVCFFASLLGCFSTAGAVLPGERSSDVSSGGGVTICYDLMDLGSYDEGEATQLPPLRMEQSASSEKESSTPAGGPGSVGPTDRLPLKKLSQEEVAAAPTVSPMVLSEPEPRHESGRKELKAVGPGLPEGDDTRAGSGTDMPSELKTMEPAAAPSERVRLSLPGGAGRSAQPTSSEIRQRAKQEKGAEPLSYPAPARSMSSGTTQGPSVGHEEMSGAYDTVADRLEVENAGSGDLLDSRLAEIYEKFYQK